MRADFTGLEGFFDEDWVGNVPTGQLNGFADFANFFASFRDSAFENTGWYNVTFYNFIEWENNSQSQLYQTAEWILDGLGGGLYSFMSEKGLAKRARISQLNQAPLTFERKELCNKPDNICKSNSIRAPTTLKPWSWI